MLVIDLLGWECQPTEDSWFEPPRGWSGYTCRMLAKPSPFLNSCITTITLTLTAARIICLCVGTRRTNPTGWILCTAHYSDYQMRSLAETCVWCKYRVWLFNDLIKWSPSSFYNTTVYQRGERQLMDTENASPHLDSCFSLSGLISLPCMWGVTQAVFQARIKTCV